MGYLLPVLNQVEQAIQKGLREAGEAVLDRSNANAPTDSGELRGAGFVDVTDLEVQVGYDHPKGYPYIARQHEDMDYQHPGGGGPKFLEKAVDEVDVAGIVLAAVRRAVG